MSEELQKKIEKINNTKYLKTEQLDSIVNKEQLDKLFDDNDFVVVDMPATWCGPCQRAKPKIIEMSKREEYSHIKFVTCDLDESEDDFYLVEKTSVVPTFILMNKDDEGKINIMSIFEGLNIDGLQNEIDVYMTKDL